MTFTSDPNSPEDTISVVRTVLRQATQEHHGQLNRHPMLAGLTKPNYSLTQYQNLLCAYFDLYQWLENRIIQFLNSQAVVFDYQQRLKSPWLLQDLTYFQIKLSRPNHEMNPPIIDNIGELIGMLYVIEGSTLGGQLISKHLNNFHGITADTGGCFFEGYGESTETFWLDFIRFSASIDGDESLCLEAKNSACQTFRFFTQVLDAATALMT